MCIYAKCLFLRDAFRENKIYRKGGGYAVDVEKRASQQINWMKFTSQKKERESTKKIVCIYK